ITRTTHLDVNAPCTCPVSPQIIEWQVVEYTGANVQTNDVTFSGLSQLVTPATAVSRSRSILIYSYFTDASGPAIGDRLVEGRIRSGGTQLGFDRPSTGAGRAIARACYLTTFAACAAPPPGSVR